MTAEQRPEALRRVLQLGVSVDVPGTAACLGGADRIAALLSISPKSVRRIGAVFAAAAGSGTATLLRPAASTRGIVAANYAFAATCLIVAVAERPPAVSAALLAGAAASAVALGWAEQRLGRQSSIAAATSSSR